MFFPKTDFSYTNKFYKTLEKYVSFTKINDFVIHLARFIDFVINLTKINDFIIHLAKINDFGRFFLVGAVRPLGRAGSDLGRFLAIFARFSS